MTVVADQAKAVAIRTQLELRGFQVIKIVPAAYTKTVTGHLTGHGRQILPPHHDSREASVVPLTENTND